jgi:LysM repeat protein
VNPPPTIEHAQNAETPAAPEPTVVAESTTTAEPTRQPGPEKPQQRTARSVAQRPAATRPVANVPSTAKFYVVKPGDTLEKIARLHGTTIQAVRSANKMKGDMIRPGQKLQLAPEGRTPLQVRTEKSKRSNEA